jgi:hypothetical protein
VGGSFTSPDRPAGYREDPLARAQGGVRLGNERAKELVRKFTEYGPEVQERIIGIAKRIRQESGNSGEALETNLESLNEILRDVRGRLPDGWTYDDLLREFDAEIAKRESDIAPPSRESAN